MPCKTRPIRLHIDGRLEVQSKLGEGVNCVFRPWQVLSVFGGEVWPWGSEFGALNQDPEPYNLRQNPETQEPQFLNPRGNTMPPLAEIAQSSTGLKFNLITAHRHKIPGTMCLQAQNQQLIFQSFPEPRIPARHREALHSKLPVAGAFQTSDRETLGRRKSQQSAATQGGRASAAG